MQRIVSTRTLAALLATAAGSTALYALIPDTEAGMWARPDLARILLFHLPCAFLTTGLVFWAAYSGLRFLLSRDPRWDARCAAASELGFLAAVLTMATGILFSAVQWGAWWQWDPRQTSFLYVLLMLAASVLLRAAHGDEQRRAAAGSSYAVAIALPAIFLIFVYPRLPHVMQQSFHPSTTIRDRELHDWYAVGPIVVGLAVLHWTVVAYRARVARLVRDWENFDDGTRQVGADPAAPSGVVEPVSVSEDR